MYTGLSSQTVAAITADSRTFRAALVFDGGRILDGAVVGRWTTDHAQTADDTLQLGGVLSRRAEIMLHDAPWLPAKGERFKLYLWPVRQEGEAVQTDLSLFTHRTLSLFTHAQLADGIDIPIGGDIIPMGEYFVRRIRISAHTARLTAYDGLQRADAVPYAPRIALPASSDEVADDIAGQLGLSGHIRRDGGHLRTSAGQYVIAADEAAVLVSAEYRFTVSSVPQDATCADMLGAVAAVYGGNFVTDREGRLTTWFYTAGVGGGSQDARRFDMPEVADTDAYLHELTCTVSGETVFTNTFPQRNASPVAVEMQSPYMTEDRFRALVHELDHANLVWRPGDIRYRLGDPRLDLGDRPSKVPCWKEDGTEMFCSVLVTSITYDFDGGLICDIISAGDTGGDI